MVENIKLKAILEEDFINYKKCSMFLGTTECDFKCARDGNFPISVCQNASMHGAPLINIGIKQLVDKYLDNQLTHAVVIGGMEPFDSFDEVYSFVLELRKYSDDDIVIYSGYYPSEIEERLRALSMFKNIIVKFGRYVPNREKIFSKELGVELASDNQYALRL